MDENLIIMVNSKPAFVTLKIVEDKFAEKYHLELQISEITFNRIEQYLK